MGDAGPAEAAAAAPRAGEGGAAGAPAGGDGGPSLARSFDLSLRVKISTGVRLSASGVPEAEGNRSRVSSSTAEEAQGDLREVSVTFVRRSTRALT